jgi:hypothetical protein
LILELEHLEAFVKARKPATPPARPPTSHRQFIAATAALKSKSAGQGSQSMSPWKTLQASLYTPISLDDDGNLAPSETSEEEEEPDHEEEGELT